VGVRRRPLEALPRCGPGSQGWESRLVEEALKGWDSAVTDRASDAVTAVVRGGVRAVSRGHPLLEAERPIRVLFRASGTAVERSAERGLDGRTASGPHEARGGGADQPWITEVRTRRMVLRALGRAPLLDMSYGHPWNEPGANQAGPVPASDLNPWSNNVPWLR